MLNTRWDGPDAIEAYLQAGEVRLRDSLRKGVQKEIVWHHPDRRPTGLAIVYLHGFSASHRELAPIPERLASLQGANLFNARLAGHGLPGPSLANATLADWQADAREALEIGLHIGRKAVVMGMSTGAALGVWLAAQSPAQIAALILISPNFGLRSPLARLLPYRWGRLLLRPISGRIRSWEPLNSRHGCYWTTRYPMSALFPVGQLIAQVRLLSPADISPPVLMIVSPRDRVINARLAARIFNRFVNPLNRFIYFEGSQDPEQHILGGEIVSPASTGILIKEITAFMGRILA
jgi:pimeloyl-ACP methyl ester carboxylesterase